MDLFFVIIFSASVIHSQKPFENSEDHVSDPYPSARSMFTSNFVETKSTVHF